MDTSGKANARNPNPDNTLETLPSDSAPIYVGGIFANIGSALVLQCISVVTSPLPAKAADMTAHLGMRNRPDASHMNFDDLQLEL